MTAEAKEWIKQLMKDPRGVFHELEDDTERGVFKAVLDCERITQEEWDKALYFSKNGSPSITVEYRDPAYS